MPRPPCYGMTELFIATPAEIRDPHAEDAESYAQAKLVCNGQPANRIKPCPLRKECAEQGLRYGDKHTVRCGLRLWVPEERALLAEQAE